MDGVFGNVYYKTSHDGCRTRYREMCLVIKAFGSIHHRDKQTDNEQTGNSFNFVRLIRDQHIQFTGPSDFVFVSTNVNINGRQQNLEKNL